MRLTTSDLALIALMWALTLIFVAGHCWTGEIGFLPFAGICGGGLVAAVDIATLLWPYRR